MATDSIRGDASAIDDTEHGGLSFAAAFRTVLEPLASLKLTIGLFAAAIFIVFAGTLAQVDKDIWQVIDEYFRVKPWGGTLGFAWIEFQVFFPPSFFPSRPRVPGGFWFPGGWLIGALMLLNLLAAHLLRFRVQAKGSRLLAGSIVTALGLGLTALVIASGSNSDGLQGTPLLSWTAVWWLLLGSVALLSLVSFAWRATLEPKRKAERWTLAVLGGVLGAAFLYFAVQGNDGRLSDSAMRILWQLTKGTLAGVVLLVGCLMVFRKRAGIVLLHGGIGLMMISELVVGMAAVEGQMQIAEGETVNFARDIRAVELAVVDPADADENEVTVIPQSVLLGGQADTKISHDLLPFDVRVVEYMRNSDIARADEESAENPATAGLGKTWMAKSVRPSAGTDTNSSVDFASAYVELSDKKTGKSLGTYLLSQWFSVQDIPEKVTVDGKTYDVALRFKRMYKPYSVHLIDVRKDDYIGTDTPRNYSSDVRLVDAERSVDREVHIWMNNPLRYAGETFYQSSYSADPRTGKETTTLAVVTNTGWMIPYVACMLVAVGMLAHFSIVLVRFLNRRMAAEPAFENEIEPATITDARRSREERRARKAVRNAAPSPSGGIAGWLVPLAVVLIGIAYFGGKLRTPNPPAESLNLYEFGKIPVVYQGRAKPLDTLARNSLQVLSNKETFVDDDDEKQPAVKWLLDVIVRPAAAFEHRVFRIDTPQLLDILGLEHRTGSYRYALAEFNEKLPELERQAQLASKLNPDQMDLTQKKVLELRKKIITVRLLMEAFSPPSIRAETAREDLMEAIQRQQELAKNHPPLLIPPESKDEEWEMYQVAWTKDLVQTVFAEQKPDPYVASMTAIFQAYANGDAKSFNREVQKYQSLVGRAETDQVNLTKVDFEAYFNHINPFVSAIALYVLAFVLACLSWLGWHKVLSRSAFWLIVFTLVVHTFALGARIYISGRPPVTNLYSSAVFIGWGAVIFGLVLELVYRIGIGNVIAAVSGFATLLIANFLAGDGDTFTVLQAVLDTQFWLATHVTCITLGYSTTFVAGLLGLVYVIAGVFTPALSPDLRRSLGRMIYGVLCFAIFFSFVGTVLGGLWADDSWGRFWGWDPKENGALIIVLWNALVLHARWDGMVKDRGLAVLAIGGNIMTSWSWFGVNELGVGLHSYGFTEGVLLTLGVFVLSQLAIIGLGCLPKNAWWSHRSGQNAA